MHVLVADDEPAMRDALRRALVLAGHSVALAVDGPDALLRLAERQPDAVVLDVLMPHVDGLEVCRRVRAAGDDTPVLLLTVRDRVEDVVAGLDAGADDYLTKPFHVAELTARLRALTRRAGGADAERLRVGDLSMDLGTREVRRGGRALSLTRTEFALLEMFLRNPRRVLTRGLLVDAVWGYDGGPRSNSLDVYVSYLRSKLEAEGEPRVLETVRGVGYVLRPP